MLGDAQRVESYPNGSLCGFIGGVAVNGRARRSAKAWETAGSAMDGLGNGVGRREWSEFGYIIQGIRMLCRRVQRRQMVGWTGDSDSSSREYISKVRVGCGRCRGSRGQGGGGKMKIWARIVTQDWRVRVLSQ